MCYEMTSKKNNPGHDIFATYALSFHLQQGHLERARPPAKQSEADGPSEWAVNNRIGSSRYLTKIKPLLIRKDHGCFHLAFGD
jgi:hypothetical protein